MTPAKREFWRRFPGLVWSNPEADDSVHIRAALLQPRFHRLLDIAVEFGLERLRGEWELLKRQDTPRTRHAEPAVERILKHIEEGFHRATTGH